MEQGSLRCDANVSLRPSPDAPLGTRTETKNVNSLRSVERALTYEIRRQAAVLTAGGTVTQETRHFHEDTGVTTPGRSKETAEDYRYFPEPDLVPIAPSREWVEELRAQLPEPPAERVARLTAEYGYTVTEMRDVTAAGALDLIEVTVRAGTSPQAARKWWMGELSRTAREIGKELEELPITPEQVVEVQQLVESGALTDKLARQALEGVVAGEGTVGEVVDGRGLVVVSDEGALAEAVDVAIAADPAAVARIRDGKVQAAGALIGAVMKQMSGKADAARIRELVLERVGTSS
jgi:aspartyl-tRNA(Asn)/glutamyl-tRNA(Gln) amidotransferase subunit B